MRWPPNPTPGGPSPATPPPAAHVRFYQGASAIMTPFFQADARSLPWLRDLVFDRMKVIPWLRREQVRTLAGLKTGLFTHRDAATLAGLR